MNMNITQLTDEAHEIVTNIRNAAQNGEITWEQRDELIRIVLKNVADQAGLQLARELLYAWQ